MTTKTLLPRLAGLAITLALPGYAQAQAPQPLSPAQADRNLAQEKAEMKNAYRSGDKAAIAREGADARKAYTADYQAHHQGPSRRPSRRHHHHHHPDTSEHDRDRRGAN